jgi:hypothetical protein
MAAETDRVAALTVERIELARKLDQKRDELLERDREARDAILRGETSHPPIGIRNRMLQNAARRLHDEIVTAYERAGYRQAKHSHTVKVTCRLDVVKAESRAGRANPRDVGLPNAYAKKAFFVATSEHELTVRPSWRQNVARRNVIERAGDFEAHGLAVVDGMLTLDARPVDGMEDAFEAVWVRQGRGTDLVTERGVIVRIVDTRPGRWPIRWTHARSVEHARKLRRDADPAARTEQEARRAQRNAQREAEIARRRTSIDAWTESERACILDLETSESAGNCASGTLDWAYKRLPGSHVERGWTTVGDVLEAAFWSGDRIDFAVRACLLAVRRRSRQKAA